MLRHLQERIALLYRPEQNGREKLSARFFCALRIASLLELVGFLLFAVIGILSATAIRALYSYYNPAYFTGFAVICFRISGYILLLSIASFILAHVGGVVLGIWEELVSRTHGRKCLTLRECLRKEIDFERWAK